MDVLGWVWWLVTSFLGLVWALLWFLLGGWVSTLAQIGVIVLVVFGYKYGWRRAPQELMSRAAMLARFTWAWMRTGEARSATTATPAYRERDPSRDLRRREPGDVQINLSTLLSLLMLLGLWSLSALGK